MQQPVIVLVQCQCIGSCCRERIENADKHRDTETYQYMSGNNTLILITSSLSTQLSFLLVLCGGGGLSTTLFHGSFEYSGPFELLSHPQQTIYFFIFIFLQGFPLGKKWSFFSGQYYEILIYFGGFLIFIFISICFIMTRKSKYKSLIVQ